MGNPIALLWLINTQQTRDMIQSFISWSGFQYVSGMFFPSIIICGFSSEQPVF